MVYICASPTSSTTVLDVSAPGPLSSTVRCLCFTQCTSCKSLFSFSLLGHYYCCNIRSLTQLFNERKSSRDYWCTTTTSFKLFSPGLLLPRALLMVYICALPTSSTIIVCLSTRTAVFYSTLFVHLTSYSFQTTTVYYYFKMIKQGLHDERLTRNSSCSVL